MGGEKKQRVVNVPSPPSVRHIASLLVGIGVSVQRWPDPGQEEATDATLRLHLGSDVSLVGEVLGEGAARLSGVLAGLLARRSLLILPRGVYDAEPVVAMPWENFAEIATYARAGLAAREVLATDEEDVDPDAYLLDLADELEAGE